MIKTKRIMAFLLTIIMAFSLFSTPLYAISTPTAPQVEIETPDNGIEVETPDNPPDETDETDNSEQPVSEEPVTEEPSDEDYGIMTIAVDPDGIIADFMDHIGYGRANLWKAASGNRTGINYGDVRTGLESTEASYYVGSEESKKGLVCASFVTFYFNWLVNVHYNGSPPSGVQALWAEISKNGGLLTEGSVRAVPTWYKHFNTYCGGNGGTKNGLTFYNDGTEGSDTLIWDLHSDIVPGDVIIFTNSKNGSGPYIHLAVYAGKDGSGIPWVIDLGSSTNGPRCIDGRAFKNSYMQGKTSWATAAIHIESAPTYSSVNESHDSTSTPWDWSKAFTVNVHKTDGTGTPIQGAQFAVNKNGSRVGTITTGSDGNGSYSISLSDGGTAYSGTYYYVTNWDEISPEDQASYLARGYYTNYTDAHNAAVADANSKAASAKADSMDIDVTISVTEASVPPPYENSGASQSWTVDGNTTNVTLTFNATNYQGPDTDETTATYPASTEREITVEIRKEDKDHPGVYLSGFEFTIQERDGITGATTSHNVTTSSTGTATWTFKHSFSTSSSKTYQYIKNYDELSPEQQQTYRNWYKNQQDAYNAAYAEAKDEAERQLAAAAAQSYTYTVTEVTAPSPYTIDSTPQVKTGSGNASLSFTQKNEPEKGKITIIKQGPGLDSVSNGSGNQYKVFNYTTKNYASAQFIIYADENIYDYPGHRWHDSGDEVGTFTTGPDGTVTTPELYLGRYRVVEVQAPANLCLPENVAERTHIVTLSYANQTVPLVTESTTFVDSRPSITLTAQKNDINDSTPLAGAEFTLYADQDITGYDGTVKITRDTAIEKVTSDASGRVQFKSDLPIGFRFRVEETLAPVNYIRNNDVYTFTTSFTNQETYTYSYSHTYVDTPQMGPITITKQGEVLNTVTDGSDNKYKVFNYITANLPGAVFNVYANTDIYSSQQTIAYHAGDLVESVTTGDSGTALTTNLYIGQYRIVEVQAPHGYLLPKTEAERTHIVNLEYKGQDVEFTFASTTFSNARPETAWSLTKVDEEDNSTIQHAEFVIYAGEDIKNYKGETVLSANTAIEKVVTDANGAANFTSDFPIDFSYYVLETLAPTNYYNKREQHDINYEYQDDSVYTYPDTHTFVDQPVKGTVDLRKVDKELFYDSNENAIDKNGAQGDATLEGAVYAIYAAENIMHPNGKGSIKFDKDTQIATATTDAEGRIQFTDLYLGKYYVKELSPSEGYLLDPTVYNVTISYVDQNVAIVKGQIQADQALENTELITSPEQVILQAFKLAKVSAIDESGEIEPIPGAEFTVKLTSDIQKLIDQGHSKQEAWDMAPTYWTMVTDDEGMVQSIPLPYGDYTVRETGVPKDLSPVPDFYIDVETNEPECQSWMYLNDTPLQGYIKLIKRDAETGRTVLLRNTTFKIKDSEGNYVSFKVGDKHIDTFTTDENGYAQTYGKVLHGKYTVVEIQAPYGYTINENEIEFELTSGAYRVDDDGDPVLDVYIDNVSVKGQIEVTKLGEGLVSAQLNEAGNLPYTDFTYEQKNMPGAVFQIIAAEDIMSADNNNVIVYAKGTVVDTITTDATGKAISKELPLGKYTVKEITAPTNHVLPEGDAAEQSAELTYEDQHTALVFDRAHSYTDVRQKTDLQIEKKDVENENKLLQGAVFNLYNKNNIVDFDGHTLIEAGTVIETVITDENGHAEFVSDLPLGEYYLKEITPPLGYVTIKEDIPVDFTYKDQTVEVQQLLEDLGDHETYFEVIKQDEESNYQISQAVLQVFETNNDPDDLQVAEGPAVDEWTTVGGESHTIRGLVINRWYALVEKTAPYGYYNDGKPTFFYVEDTFEKQIVTRDNVQIRGKIEVTKLGEKLTAATNENGKVIFTYEDKPLQGVKFNIYAAENIVNVDGNSAVWYQPDDLVDTITTDENGVATTKELPLGKYYIKEIQTIDGFVLDTERHDVEIVTQGETVRLVMTPTELDNQRQKVHITLRKTDVESGEPLAETEFTLYCRTDITDYTGKVILSANTPIAVAKSGADGTVNFDVDLPLGYTYYIRETSPTPGYATNGGDNDVYEFEARYAGDSEEFAESGDLHATNQKTKHVFRKTDISTDQPLDGALLAVLHIEKDEDDNLRTDENGYVTTPVDSWTSDASETTEFDGKTYNGHLVEGLVVGETYIFRETMAPTGYVGYNASSDATKEANREENTITQEVMFTVQDTKVMVEHNLKDQAVVGNITVSKTGEILIGFEEPGVIDKFVAHVERIFNYLTGNIKDVTFEIYAAEDIKHPDGVSEDLYKKGDLVDTITTNYLGVATSKDLPLGKYVVKEATAGEGFVLNVEPKEVTLSYVDQDTPKVSGETGFENQRQKVSITVAKKATHEAEYKYTNTDEIVPDGNGDISLAGAVFGLYNKDIIYADQINDDGSVTQSETVYLPADTLIEVAVSDDQGTVHFTSDLPLGNYYVKELRAPVGYHTSDEVLNFTCEYAGQDTQTVVMTADFYNIPVVVAIPKVAADTQEGIVGSTLVVKDAEGNVVDTWTTDGTVHYVKHLVLGATYTIEETKPADGYVTIEPMTFTVHDRTEDGQIIELERLSPIIDDITVVDVEKKDEGGINELPGAKLQIFDSEGNLVDEWTSTNESHRVEKLPIGDYVLHEETPPVGYTTSPDVPFTVEDTSDEQVVKMIDHTITISLAKYDLTTTSLLEGATLQLINAGTDTVAYEWTSTDEPYVIERVPVGDYVFHEEGTPSGYATADDVNISVIDTAEEQPFAMYDDTIKVEISKKDLTTGIELPGAKLQIFDSNGELYDEWVSTSEPHFIERMPVGTYRLHEEITPDGYVTAKDIEFTVEDTGNIQSTEMLDDVTKLQVSKKDITNSEELPGATLQIKDAEGNVVDEWVSTSEPHYIEKLPVGSYTLHEEITPDGYVTAQDIPFTIEDTGDIQYVEMIDDITKVDISKKDMQTGEELPEARLQLFNEAGQLVDEWLTTDETHHIDKLPVGNYRLHEDITPAGYVTADDVYFTVEDTGDLQYFEMLDDVTKVDISKKDMTNNEELPGAKLQLFDEMGELVDEWVSSDETHYIEKLPVGKYRLHEEITPDGYVTAHDIEFTVKDTGEVQPVEMLDDITKVLVNKIDITNTEELPGAHLQIFDANGDLYDEWDTTGEPHYIEKMPVGKYTLHEDFTPSGYVTSVDIGFEVLDTGMVQIVGMTDDITKVQISKQDMTTGEELPGAKLQLFDAEGNLVDAWTSSDRPHYMEKLPVGKYTLHEEVTPDGYVTAQDVEITVEDTGDIQRTEMLDDITRVEISKKDMTTGEELPGARLQIFDSEGNLVDGWVSTHTPHYIEKLPVGEYTLHEEITPDGYVTATNVKFTVEDTGEIQKFEMLDDITRVEISKKDMTTGEELPGAHLKLFDENGNLVDEWTSGEEPHYMEKLPVGKYTLHEEITPDGYVTAEDVVFTVEDTGEIQQVEMLDDITRVEISKKDMTTGEELPGAKLQLFDGEGNLVDEWTSGEEPHYMEKLPVGKYTLHEEITPDGYVTANDVNFVVEDTGEVQQVEMLDDITKVKISKKDMTTGEELPGAKLQLFDEEGNLIDEWVSTEEEHYIEKLPVGKYTLREETAPDGYVTAEDVVFTVDDTGEIQEVEMLDDITRVEISKQDMTTGEELPGATLRIVDQNGNVVDEWVSGEEPHYIEKLPVGKYTLHEEITPNGYVTANDVEFTVEDTGEVKEVEMLDNITRLEISKKDMTNGEELPGAKLQILDQNGNVVDEWTSGSTPHYVEKLPVGTYTLREETAPNGYVTAEEIVFTVDDTGEIQKVEMLDDITRIAVVKLDSETGKPIAGATLQILDANKNVIKEWTCGPEAYRIDKLPVGEYILHEVESPKGYALTTDLSFTIKDTGELQTFEMSDKPITPASTPTPTPTPNEQIKTGEELANHSFEILMLALALVVVLTLVIYKKKKNDQK